MPPFHRVLTPFAGSRDLWVHADVCTSHSHQRGLLRRAEVHAGHSQRRRRAQRAHARCEPGRGERRLARSHARVQASPAFRACTRSMLRRDTDCMRAPRRFWAALHVRHGRGAALCARRGHGPRHVHPHHVQVRRRLSPLSAPARTAPSRSRTHAASRSSCTRSSLC